MARKDIATTENIDQQEKGDSLPVEQPKQLSTEEGLAAKIKNAHATGDGSYGRADENLPDKAEEPPAKEESY